MGARATDNRRSLLSLGWRFGLHCGAKIRLQLGGMRMRVQFAWTSLRNRRFAAMTFVAVVLLVCGAGLGVKAEQTAMATDVKDQPYAIEYYYKAKWGHAEEFLALFKKNHYPVLKKEMELGRMLKVSMVTPR